MSTSAPPSLTAALLTNMSISHLDAFFLSIGLMISIYSTINGIFKAIASSLRIRACFLVSVVATTLHPHFANTKAVSFPKPEPAPVIKIVFIIVILLSLNKLYQYQLN